MTQMRVIQQRAGNYWLVRMFSDSRATLNAVREVSQFSCICHYASCCAQHCLVYTLAIPCLPFKCLRSALELWRAHARNATKACTRVQASGSLHKRSHRPSTTRPVAHRHCNANAHHASPAAYYRLSNHSVNFLRQRLQLLLRPHLRRTRVAPSPTLQFLSRPRRRNRLR